MRHLVALLIIIPSLVLVQNSVGGEPSDGIHISGTVAFTSPVTENVHLNASVNYLEVDGKNISSDEIRYVHSNGGDAWKELMNSINTTAYDIFNRTLWTMRSHANSSISVSIFGLNSMDGPVYLNMDGAGALNISNDYDEKFLELLMDSGAVLNLTVDTVNHTELSISAPEGYVINGKGTYNWGGGSDILSIRKNVTEKENRAEVLMDIYRIDTTGMEQKLCMNLSIDSEVYWISIPGELGGKIPKNLEISRASIPLLNYSLEHSLISQKEFKKSENISISEMEDRIVRVFPGARNISYNILHRKDVIRLHINAEISAPIESFMPSSFLRWYASQKISIRLSGIEGFVCNYTVILPEGMKVLGVRSSPRIPIFYTSTGGRSAFQTVVSHPGDYRITMDLGLLIDLDPLVPLMALAVIAAILWMLVRKYVPERRGKDGPG